MAQDVHRCATVDYQQIANDNITNQIHGFTIDYGKFVLICIMGYNVKNARNGKNISKIPKWPSSRPLGIKSKLICQFQFSRNLGDL